MVKSIAVTGLCAVGFFLMLLSPVQADISASLNSNTGGIYDYKVNFVGSGSYEINTGDFFTIYDFAGFIPGSATQPANWSFSSANLGVDPGGTAPLDNAAIPNLTWTYTGGSPITVDGTVGDFFAQSYFVTTTTVQEASQFTQIAGGSSASSLNITTAPVPEPATILTAIIGLIALIPFLRKRTLRSA